MKIMIDAFGGDNAPDCCLEGAVKAKDKVAAELALVGHIDTMKTRAAELQLDLSGIELEEAPGIIDMHDDPKCVLRAKKDSSMAVGLRLVADGAADAFVSAGSTAALLMGATMIVGRLKGVKRPALGAVVPSRKGEYLLIDCGANAECRPEMLLQFGIMGSVYMKSVMGLEKPKVGLANNGSEDTKGTDLQKQAYMFLKNCEAVNFIGNVEGRDIPAGTADVMVCDGFTGNLILKTVEGLAKEMFGALKEMFYKNAVTKLAAAALKPGLREFKNSMDYTKVGGAPFIGLNRPVVKAHGSSNAEAMVSVILQAERWAKADMSAEIERALSL